MRLHTDEERKGIRWRALRLEDGKSTAQDDAASRIDRVAQA